MFLALPRRELLYGGAVGGGKSVAQLTAAAQFADEPGYAALLLRRTFRDLNQPGGLIPISKEWWGHSPASWSDRDKRWTFPSGATITFGYLEHTDDVYHYQGAAFAFIGFDELTQFAETSYRYMMSRLRRSADCAVPLRMRATSNPGGTGHAWVRQRFLVERSPDRAYVPAGLDDNPHLDRDTYRKHLEDLDAVTRDQLLHGNWDVRPEGGVFRADWLTILEPDQLPPARECDAIRYWDLAATEATKGADPDYAVGLLLRRHRPTRVCHIADVRRGRWSPDALQRAFVAAARHDGPGVPICVEQEPGASGKIVVNTFARLLPGHDCRASRPGQSKVVRAGPAAAAAERGDLRLARAAWTRELVEELAAFPHGSHDDQVDALSGAWSRLHATADTADYEADWAAIAR